MSNENKPTKLDWRIYPWVVVVYLFGWLMGILMTLDIIKYCFGGCV